MAAAFTGHVKFGQRSEFIEKFVNGLRDTLEIRLTARLADHLLPLFEADAQSVKTMLLDTSGRGFQESSINPLGSEAYKEAFRTFVKHDSDAILDFRTFIMSLDKWYSWASVQRWVFIAAMVLEGLIAASLFVTTKVFSFQVSSRMALGSLVPTAACFAVFATAAIRLSSLHDQFVELRRRYAGP